MMFRTRSTAVAALASSWLVMALGIPVLSVAQEATPSSAYSCESVAAASPGDRRGHMMGTPPSMMRGSMSGTPAAGMHDMTSEDIAFDQMYIDMMIPHHEGIIAMAQAALPLLTDERLRAIAGNIVATQEDEIEELRAYRAQWYDGPQGMPMNDVMKDMIMRYMPAMGMGDMDAMILQMNPQALVAEFCASADPDLAFIDLSIPHHAMAIQASEAALQHAEQAEIRDIAQRVIAVQQQEIDELEAIRAALSVDGTPAA